MNSFKKIAIGFGLVSIITLQGLQASKLKECEDIVDNKNCVYIRYYTNGEIQQETPFNRNGKVDGVEKEYHENGKLASEKPYKDGEINGIVKGYYESGKIEYEKPYKDGEIKGIVKGYYESGKIEYEIPYDGDPNGIAKWYYENGKLQKEAGFIRDARHGDHKFYTEDGNLIGMVHYKRGDLKFVKCAEKKLSQDEAKRFREDIIYTEQPIKIFQKYCLGIGNDDHDH